MKHTKFYLFLISVLLLTSCRDKEGLFVEVSGQVFADSEMSIPVEGVEVEILNRNDLNQRIFPARYLPDESSFTDAEGNYTVITTSQKDREYYVWIKPDIFKNTSSESNPKLKEWKANEADFVLRKPIKVALDISADSLLGYPPGERIESTLEVTGWHHLSAPSWIGTRKSETAVEISWSGDTTINLILERDTEYSIRVVCDFFNCLKWWGTTPDSDSLRIRVN